MEQRTQREKPFEGPRGEVAGAAIADGKLLTNPAGLPEVDVRPAFVILPAGTADAVFFRVLHQGLPICHVLCYTFAHEGYGSFLGKFCVATQL